MSKLHELIAVEPDLKAAADRQLSEAVRSFSTNQALMGQSRTYQPIEDEGERLPSEETKLTTTVDEQLALLAKSFGDFMDVSVQKELSNTAAFADVVVDGEMLLPHMSATSLLNLENKLATLRTLYDKIPTNEPAQQWTFDDALGCWRSAPRVSIRSKKVPKSIVLYEATKEHPAQVQSYTEDIAEGRWTTVIFSGMLSVTDKRERLGRIDTLLRAVKVARQRANDSEAVTTRVAERLFGYING